MNGKRPKILIEAYECSPLREHAPGAAWQIVRRLARWFEIWVLVEETQYRREIEAYLSKHSELSERMHFEYIPRRQAGGFGRQRPPLPILETLDYRRWQKDAFERAKRLHATHRFDLAHHLRSNTFRTPGLLWKLDCPFVWGPMGGSSGVPSILIEGLPLRRRIEYTIKNILNAVQFSGSPTVRHAVDKAAVIFTQTSADRKNLRRCYRKDSTLLHEQAADKAGGTVHRYEGDRDLNIAWSGRCIAGKAMETLLYAAANARQPRRLRLHLVGDGPEQARWKALAESLGLEPQCVWYGWVDHARANTILNACDLLAFTSILEGTSATIMKSLAMGVPIVCLKHFGMGDVVDSGCGFPVAVGTPAEVVGGFTHALDAVMADPGIIEQLSKGAMHRASSFTWNRTADTIKNAYRHCLRGAFEERNEAPRKHLNAELTAV